MLNYEIYFDETGSFTDNKSAVVGFYFEIETSTNDRGTALKEYNSKHNEIIKCIIQYFEKLNLWKTDISDGKFKILNDILKKQCSQFKNFNIILESDYPEILNYIHIYDFTHCNVNTGVYPYRDLIQMICLEYWVQCFNKMKKSEQIKDYGLIFFKNNFYLGEFLQEKSKDDAGSETSPRELAQTFNDAFSADPYLDTVAEGIVNFWMRKKLLNKSSLFHIYPSVRKLGEYQKKSLGQIDVDRYVAYLVKVAKTRLDDKHFAEFCKDLLKYRMEEMEKPNSKTGNKTDEKVEEPKTLDFDLQKFEEYMECIKNSHSLPYEWKFCDIHLVHNNVVLNNPEIYTTYIGDCFANSFWRKNSISDDKIKKLYQDIFNSVENKIFVNTIKVEDGLEDSLHNFFKDLMEENVIDILRDLYINPKIRENSVSHDESYAEDYKAFIKKNEFIIEHARRIFLQLAPTYKKGTWEQLLKKLQTEVSRIEKNFKNILIIENLEGFFNDEEIKRSCQPWIELLYIDFKIFKQKIYLDYGRLAGAVSLFNEISKLCISTNTPGVNPIFLQERKLKATINQLNYYCYTFDYATSEKFFNANYDDSAFSNQDYGKLVNIFLNTKILDVRTGKFTFNDLSKYKDKALKHFQYDGDDSRTYQICAKLANEMIVAAKDDNDKNKLRENAKAFLYNAAGLKGKDATLEKFLDTIFIESRGQKVIGDINKEFLFLLFIELLLKNDDLIDELFNLHCKHKEYGFYKIKDAKVEPNCMIYWKLGQLNTRLISKDRDIAPLLLNKFNRVDDWNFYNKALEFFDSNYTHNYDQDPLLALVKIGILCDAIKDNGMRKCTKYCYLKKLQEAAKGFCYLCCNHNVNNVIQTQVKQIEMIPKIESNYKRNINALMKETLENIPL